LDHYGREAVYRLRSDLRLPSANLKAVSLELMDVKRAYRRIELTSEVGPPDEIREITTTNAYKAVNPRVSVVIPLYNQGSYCLEALASVCAGDYHDWELILIDDASTDGSLEEVLQWARTHNDVPVRIFRHPINRGLPTTRNAGIALARGEFVFLLDSDNMLLKRGLQRLVEALDSQPDAAFAYGILACYPRAARWGWMISKFPWDPARLRWSNYIDAMALFRRAVLVAMDGYTTDRRLHGWEDYDLNCRVAEVGGFSAFVPEFIGTYRVQDGSMISVTNLAVSEAFEALNERCPTLMFAPPTRHWV
jgi:glycosyltransferase involved in cell wall biosynthesis